ncbi:hypothetical protein PIB30_035092 [Stylosanthes scabra]|uniref:Uncharacterized protein n=1 Tax=Stylosanthes scabra TaxID=79078 RepID=A0ABU6RDP4_9FABA|nr:hypothetical protein [Stylosanthes scabra]
MGSFLASHYLISLHQIKEKKTCRKKKAATARDNAALVPHCRRRRENESRQTLKPPLLPSPSSLKEVTAELLQLLPLLQLLHYENVVYCFPFLQGMRKFSLTLLILSELADAPFFPISPLVFAEEESGGELRDLERRGRLRPNPPLLSSPSSSKDVYCCHSYSILLLLHFTTVVFRGSLYRLC